jgi:hypothetical protein
MKKHTKAKRSSKHRRSTKKTKAMRKKSKCNCARKKCCPHTRRTRKRKVYKRHVTPKYKGGSDESVTCSYQRDGSSSNVAPGSFGNPFTEITRNVGYGMGSAWAALNGEEGPVNPLPFKGHLNDGRLPDDVALRI